mmetsp:Transcript_11627/g.17628  ORF Transcript_11627/g.17628 Transcript_11627/m.17628 type:complete len:363 (-) Transcript_11627:1768-2856(-)
MGVGQTRGHVEAELIIVIHLLVSQLNELVSTLDNDLFLEDGVDHGVDFVLDRLDKDGETFLKRPLEGILQTRVTQSEDAVLAGQFGFTSLDPMQSLALGIDHKRVSRGTSNHDTVLDREVIGWETLEVPLTNSGLVHEELGQLEVLRNGDSLGEQVLVEVLIEEFASEFRVEGSAVGDEGASLGDVTDESLLERFKLVSIFDPSLLVVLQGVDQPVGLVHLLSGSTGSLLEGSLLSHLVVELLSQALLESSDFSEFVFGGGQVLLGFFQLSHLDFKESKLGLHNLGLLVVVTHSSSPDAHTSKCGRSFLGDFLVEDLSAIGSDESEVRLKELDGLLVDVILLVVGEVHQFLQESVTRKSELG